ncbi:MAG: hypothetical protein QT11_C0001G0335 [archaeon GW2011_AR20]|nr:MAG: hypothetical protein QT11_C0001G0335 [archaeon GW2011_AR20]AQS28012.1 hypothetical protein [uncultured archaeon]AQS28503.1 hypothetical protein [uncultured archaeon]AQS28613.1 hypothetical protein [uncultured archaeon]MBS3160343.1 hypothetical protein [Candidatus Woesearchaeota archaeon]
MSHGEKYKRGASSNDLNLPINDLEIDKKIRNLISKYDISENEARLVIGSLGYDAASTYTEFFFNSNLERSLYLRGIEPISKGLIKLSELKKISCFEFSVNDYLRRGGISERNLNQRGDGKRGWSTGTLKNTINPFNSGDVSEHLDSKLEDAFPEI